MSFKNIFIAVFIGTALILSAMIINAFRPSQEVEQPSAQFVKATGKCAECHRNETATIVHQFELSAHNEVGVTCLDCHKAATNQQEVEHHGFMISEGVTSQNCAACHRTQYDQFVRSRHGAPSWAAVRGSQDFTEEQIEYAERFHPGAVNRPPNALALLEGESAIEGGCLACHDIGKPNYDGSIGECTKCHSRHNTSIRLARMPETCGQCHMGPDHSQLEIYKESKHGVLFNAQQDKMNLDADPKTLTTRDMPVPTCTTCHMSGLEGMKVTHNVSERLSYFLFAAVSERRPNYEAQQLEMKEMCLKCHTTEHTEEFYQTAINVLESTNEKVLEVKQIMDDLYADGILTEDPFDEPIEFRYFDYWHYYGRTAKHGAFMGGADFVQWHGNYELLLLKVEIQEMAQELRKEHNEG